IRLPSRLTSTICGPPASGWLGFFGCGVRLTIPPIRTEPVFFGLNGSDTSYCKKSPVPQQETYRNLSSRDKLMSDISGGAALKSLSIGGSIAESADSAGISITFFKSHAPSLRCQSQTDADKSLSETTTPTKPYAFVGSCAGRISRTICCSFPKSRACKCRRRRKSQTCI